MITQFEASCSSSCAPTRSCAYDVFLSFRGEDTRSNFTGHLHSYLVHKGINTFMDDDGLPRGEEISGSLFKAIEESRISVIVFSENYVSSKWCLEELVKIMQCNESERQIVYPIFYKVDPSDVRNQGGTFDVALAHHDNLDKVMAWKTALTKAGNLSGWHFKPGEHESQLINNVVEKISQQVLNLTRLNGEKFLVGMESRLDDMNRLLRVEESAVRMVGIWGIGGLGKTTIAKAVYNLISHKFEGSCFLENVREGSLKYGGLQELQKVLVSRTLRLKELDIDSVDEGASMIKQRLSHKRVLLVLDDVNDLEQLRSLTGKSDWFGAGSRIIITTRHQDLLRRHDVKQIYKVERLTDPEALELFKFNAFGAKEHRSDCIEPIDRVIRFAEGLPLVLEVLGSHLRGISTDEWENALKCYKRDPKLQDILKLSYDALEPMVKEVFLHIACFFKGEKKNYVMDILEGCDLPKYGINVLIEKGLLRITEANDIWMHDLLEEMGKDIVCQESPEPGERSRLWLYEDVHNVFVHNTGTNRVKGIMVKDTPHQQISSRHQQISLNGTSFLKLNGLQILQISADIFYGDHVNYLPDKLSLLDWVDCPLQYFPHRFHLSRKLIVLKMSFISRSMMSLPQRVLKMGFLHASRYMEISPLGNGLQTTQNLKSIELVDCDGITSTSDFSKLCNLVDLKLRNCKNVVKLDPLLGFPKTLVNLEVSGSGKVKKFEVVKEMKSLKRLDLSRTAIKKLSSSTIGCLINLERLTLSGCKKLKYVPCNISELQHLELIDLSFCTMLVTFPKKSELPIESTSLQGNHYAPFSIDLHDCSGLVEITEFRREIYSLDASQCAKLKSVSLLSAILEGKESRMIPRINLSGCRALYASLVCDVSNLPDNSELTALFYFFFSCWQSEYQVLLNTSGSSSIPYWFRCRYRNMNFKGREVCYFTIYFPKDFKWENKGLAFCISTRGYEAYKVDPSLGIVTIYIDGTSIVDYFNHFWFSGDGLVWLYYMPLDANIIRLRQNGLPIKFDFQNETQIQGSSRKGRRVSCGVHVVMREDDEGPVPLVTDYHDTPRPSP